MGINEDDLETENDVGKLQDFVSVSKLGEDQRRKPRCLFQYPESPEIKQVLQRSRVLKDFAFPNGVKCKQLTDVDSQESVDLLR